VLADFIAGLILAGSFLSFVPIMAYLAYCDFRKQQEINKDD